MVERCAERTDKSSQANMGAIDFKHLELDIDVDFEAKAIHGSATWTVLITDAAAKEVVYDTSGGLIISEASVEGARVEHYFKPPHKALGTALAVPLPEALCGKAGCTVRVKLKFSTADACSALQWLPPAQTAGKEHPYMFSQCQAIHARSLIPCADAPTAKFTYDATVRVPDWATALMSAVADGSATGSSGGTKTFKFKQSVPVPSYLVAIAVGELRGIKTGPRSTIWAEPAEVEKAAWELGGCEAYIATAEKLLGVPYIWGIYDVLVLPPSFPFGGMENPCLTFATPTLLAGDRSLANVICHEVAHSWTGNLVTNHTWEHFWLNEGWTRWLEITIQIITIQARIEADATGSEDKADALTDFLMQDAKHHLESDIAAFGADNPLTALVPPLDGGVDPDDAFGAVPYEKGLALLTLLTGVVGGRKPFMQFAARYIQAYQRKTLTSADFRDFFLSDCEAHGVDASSVDWDAWFYTPGMPPVDTLAVQDTLGASAVELVEAWLAEPEASATDTVEPFPGRWGDFSAKLKIHYLDTLCAKCEKAPSPPLSHGALKKMDRLYGLTQTKNAEMRLRWQRVCILHRFDAIVPHVLAFLKEAGRMKFTRPLYRALYGWEAQRELAVATFKEWKENYHPICQAMVSKDLKLE